jgi:hypothetical protein
MRVKRLHIPAPGDYALLGIVSPVRDYKMAWLINNCLSINLQKAKPIAYSTPNEQTFFLHHYLFLTENGFMRMLPNKCEREGTEAFIRLLPEFKAVDYFLQIDDQGHSFNVNAIIARLKSLEFIQYIINIENLNQRTKETLAF